MKVLLLLFVPAAIICACSGSGQQTRIRYQRNVLSEEEIQQSNATNAYELIRLKRPEFLRAHGPKAVTSMASSSRLPVVYLNGMRYGYPEDLTKIPAESVKEVRYLNDVDANLQLGLGHSAGAVLITTNRAIPD